MYNSPIEQGDEMVWSFYSIIEDTLNDEYSKVDFKVAATLAINSINQILDFMKMDDEDSGTCSNANSKWVNYWLEVTFHIRNKYILKIKDE
jgi:hypothetical protein